MGSPVRVAVAVLAVCAELALLHAAAVSREFGGARSARIMGLPAPPAVRGSSPSRASSTRLHRVPRSGVHTATGRILFSVRVPVLSVQITSVQPSVSTALSRLTSARGGPGRRPPTASASVITGQQALRDVAGEQPDREHDAAVRGEAGPPSRDAHDATSIQSATRRSATLPA